jgi:hypothetical protein
MHLHHLGMCLKILLQCYLVLAFEALNAQPFPPPHYCGLVDCGCGYGATTPSHLGL